MSQSIKFVEQVVSLSGDITSENAQLLNDQMKYWDLPTAVQVVVDLTAVSNVDTSSLALCLSIERAFKAQANTISYLNVPENMREIAQSVGVESMFA